MKEFDLEKWNVSNQDFNQKQLKETSPKGFQELSLPYWEGSMVPIRIEPFVERSYSSSQKSIYKKNCQSSKFKLWLEDGTFICVYISEIREFQLKEKIEANCPIEGDEYSLFMQVLCKRARVKAMSLLKDRDRTEGDIRSRLSQNGFPEQVIEDSILYLYHYHYLDDTRFISQYLFQNRGRKSTKQIVQELKQKGISNDNIEQALQLESEFAQIDNSENKEEKAAKMLYEKYCRRKPVEDKKSQQKAAAYLMGKGFSWETVRLVVFDSNFDDSRDYF